MNDKAMRVAEQFFAEYASALLARDAAAVARLYAVPSVILFPGNSVAVNDQAQTEAFFASAWGQYDGVDEAVPEIAIMASTPASIWADVTWRYNGAPRERLCYQLIPGDDDAWRIAVLTPLL